MAAAPPPQVWSKDDVTRLKAQAENHLRQQAARYPNNDSVVQLKFVTRDESPEYYDTIKMDDGLMMPYPKDGYGSPQNPINHQLSGLFFGATVEWSTGEPYTKSYYGSRRLQLPVGDLLTLDKHLYFADFYCMATSDGSRRRHTVTLVLCEPDSEDDQFCRDALPLLDINDNPFLYVTNPPPELHVKVTKDVYVEIFYTNQMDIRQYPDDHEYWQNIELKGNGLRDPNPRKNLNCQICNLQEIPQNQ